MISTNIYHLFMTSHSLSTEPQPHNKPTLAESDEIRLLAQTIKQSPFAVPLRFLIDSHLPLRGIVQSSLDICGPLLTPFVAEKTRVAILKALAEPTDWQQLVDFLYEEEPTS
jgi:hypothetical protein